MPTPPSAVPDAFVAICPSRAVLTRIAEKWTWLALVAMEPGPQRFGALRRRMEGVSQKMLSQTLRNLERDGLVRRELHDVMPLRVEYSLTPLGVELMPLVQALKTWAEQRISQIDAANRTYDKSDRKRGAV